MRRRGPIERGAAATTGDGRPAARAAKVALRFRKDITRTLIDYHVRRAIDEGTIRGRILNISAGTQTYEADIRRFDGNRMIITDWPRSPTHNRVDLFCDAHELPFAGNVFDSVICTEVLEHLAEPRRAMTEMHRVLTTGGNLLLTTPFQYQAHQRPFDFFRFTYDGLELLTREAGFRETKIYRRGEALAVALNSMKVFARRSRIPFVERLLRLVERLYVRWYAPRSLAVPLALDPMALGYSVVTRKMGPLASPSGSGGSLAGP